MTEISGSKILNQAELEEELRKSQQKAEHEASRRKKYHSLDSDEEDEKVEAQKYNVLDPSELEGQEESTIDYDDEIKITPFNMKEELEEGYFDKDGTYIFQKENDVVKDQWLDDIDWIKIKSIENKRKDAEQSDGESNEELPQVNLLEHYKKMLEIMKPRETVQKAICRLGGGSKSSRSASSRWKKNKLDDQQTDMKNEEDSEKLQQLTSFANDIVQSGDMDIYQQTYEKLSFYVNSREKSVSNVNANDDGSLDMFGEDFDEKVVEEKNKTEASNESPHTEAADSEVMWEFKWETQDDAKVYGPFPTSQMLQWVQEKYFENGVLVRQIGKQEGQFYSSKRIDFELYL